MAAIAVLSEGIRNQGGFFRTINCRSPYSI